MKRYKLRALLLAAVVTIGATYGDDKTVDQWVKKKIPGDVTNMIPTRGGDILAISVTQLRKIVLLQASTGNKLKYIRIPSTEFIMTAADNYLFVYYPTLKIIEKHDLKTFKRVGAKRVKFDGVITVFEMGLKNPDVAFVSYSNSTGSLDRRLYGLLDMSTGKIRPLVSKVKDWSSSRPNRFWNTSYRDRIRVSADDSLRHIACCCSGYEYVTLDLKKAEFENTYQHSSYGGMTLSSDGSRTFSTSGCVFQKQKQIKQFPKTSLFRVVDGSYFVQLAEKQISIREMYSLSEVRKMELPFNLPRDHYRSYNRRDSTFKRPERMVVASARPNRVHILDSSTNTVYTRPLLPTGMTIANSKTGGNSLIVTPGSKWTFNLMLPAGFTATIEDAPNGVTLSKGILSWKAPKGTSKGVKEILISIKNKEGAESYRVIKAVVK